MRDTVKEEKVRSNMGREEKAGRDKVKEEKVRRDTVRPTLLIYFSVFQSAVHLVPTGAVSSQRLTAYVISTLSYTRHTTPHLIESFVI
ncbi:hypothetical protein Pmani_019601 [Petrolisthes manimaculis]|uniref:Uncharacterized protein n=1 Tax=Petrolisthes manimaculis TaxID=1843537 RepID=A0AAE1PK27_9EUCA|nr:hypothetical protein Pmani_019601 [Petrolisthes manimaculis]